MCVLKQSPELWAEFLRRGGGFIHSFASRNCSVMLFVVHPRFHKIHCCRMQMGRHEARKRGEISAPQTFSVPQDPIHLSLHKCGRIFGGIIHDLSFYDAFRCSVKECPWVCSQQVE